MSDDRMCYVASSEGQPGAFAACADMKDLPKETAKFVAEHVRKGHIVNRVTTEKAREMLGEWLAWDKLHGKRSKKQGELLSGDTSGQ